MGIKPSIHVRPSLSLSLSNGNASTQAKEKGKEETHRTMKYCASLEFNFSFLWKKKQAYMKLLLLFSLEKQTGNII